MPRRVPSPFNFFAHCACLHLYTILQQVDQRRFSDSAGTGNGRRLPPKILPDRFNTFFLCRADKQQRISTVAIAFPYFRDHFVGSQIRLVHTDQCRKVLFFHQNQKSIQQIKIGFRTHKGKNNKRLIHICYCRTDQTVCSRQDFIQISFFFCFVQDADRNQVARQGLFLILSENPPCTAFIYTLMGVHIIKSADSPDDFSLHPLILPM